MIERGSAGSGRPLTAVGHTGLPDPLRHLP